MRVNRRDSSLPGNQGQIWMQFVSIASNAPGAEFRSHVKVDRPLVEALRLGGEKNFPTRRLVSLWNHKEWRKRIRRMCGTRGWGWRRLIYRLSSGWRVSGLTVIGSPFSTRHWTRSRRCPSTKSGTRDAREVVGMDRDVYLRSWSRFKSVGEKCKFHVFIRYSLHPSDFYFGFFFGLVILFMLA